MTKNILFLCTGNSCRSQMAEGFSKVFRVKDYQSYSAGVKTHGLNPLAVKVMQEVGIDISTHQSQLVTEFNNINFDIVVTVCDNAKESCPVFPDAVMQIHHSFDDPPTLTKGFPEEEALKVYRRVRDEIKTFVLSLP